MCRSYYWKTWVDTFPKEFSTKSARNGILRLFQDWERMLWCFNDSVSVCVFDRFLTVNSTVDIIQPPLRYSAYRECIYSCRPLMMQYDAIKIFSADLLALTFDLVPFPTTWLLDGVGM